MQPAAPDFSSGSERPVIELAAIRRRYKAGGGVNALDGVDLKIFKNEYVAIMGHSGSGKSTLMNVLGCLDRPTGGKYLLTGKDVTRLGDGSLARIRNQLIGFVFQSFELLPSMSAFQNVQMPLIYSSKWLLSRKKQARQALETVGLAHRMHHKPNQLSGGEKQRVAIARALICKPGIILADEPTGNLDTKTSEEILKLFRDLHNQGHTVIMVTHEEDVACHAQRVVRLRDGRILSDLAVKDDQVWLHRGPKKGADI